MDATRRTCLLTLPFPGATATSWVAELDGRLRSQELSLLVVSVAPQALPGAEAIRLPFFLADLPAFLPDLAPEDGQPCTGAMVDCDTAWLALASRAPDEDASARGAGLCRTFARRLVRERRPAFALLWHSPTPQTRLFEAVLREAGVPVLFIEQGFVPGTLMVDVCGMVGDTELRRSFGASPRDASPRAIERCARVRDRLRATRGTKRAQAPFRDPDAFRREALGPSRHLVAFVGQCDVAAGLWPGTNERMAVHSPGFASTAAALDAVAAAARARGDCRVLFKPHPTQPFPAELPEGVTLASDVHLHTLIEAADVVAGQSSTTLFDAVLLQRPVLLLGHSALSHRGLVEAHAAADVPQALAAALDPVEQRARQARIEPFLAWIVDRYLIRIDPDVPAGRDLDELADHVAALALPCDVLASHAYRI